MFFLKVQNLALRQQGASSSSQTTGLQALSLKQTPVSIQPTPLIKTPSQVATSSGTTSGKSLLPGASGDAGKKQESGGETEAKAVNMSRSVTSSHHLIAPGKSPMKEKRTRSGNVVWPTRPD